ncbi:amidohydrolase family protein [Sediminitomix flava]|uniref:adenosine deaminase n=1 Tax=Sediminitomix flava TaxID=379075 RepID=A0A315Z9C2_SEDFL|nr:hypothetical protein [Sediminitomix flava]PWJ41019.1 adenosine deaminase [Sediminitomix flava]
MLKQLSFTFFILIYVSSCKSSSNTTTSKTATLDHIFELAKKDDRQLLSFFTEMPKGGDLHHHASGTPYAEQFIENALADSAFINPKTYKLSKSKLADKDAIPIHEFLKSHPSQKDSIIDQWSVRNHKSNGRSGHDWFFESFPKFDAAFVGHESELLSQICEKAANDNIQYIETIINVPNVQDSVKLLADQNSWEKDNRPTEEKLEAWLTYFEEKGIDKWAKANADSLDAFLSRTNTHGIKLKFQTFGLRIFEDQSLIFGHTILSFKTALLTDNLVGVNFVAPEDNALALKNYKLHMQMFGFLKKKYPFVNVALHAGELVLGKGEAQPNDLTFHIDEALTIAKAKRIGHGVDISSEDRKDEILKFMKENGLAVEINLESNEVILETDKSAHPIKTYWESGVPICISTDDEGVLRTNLINQYILLTKYLPEITYSEVKELVYNGIKYSFLSEKEKNETLKALDQKFKLFESSFLNS